MKRAKSLGSFLGRGRTKKAVVPPESAKKLNDGDESATKGAAERSSEEDLAVLDHAIPCTTTAVASSSKAPRSTSSKSSASNSKPLKKSASAASLGGSSGGGATTKKSNLASLAKQVFNLPAQQQPENKLIVRVAIADDFEQEGVRIFTSSALEKELSTASSSKGLPSKIKSGATGVYTGTKGWLKLPGFEPVQFSAGSAAGGLFVGRGRKGADAFVGEHGKTRHTVIGAPHWDWRDAFAEKPERGWTAELEIIPCYRGDASALFQHHATSSGGENASSSDHTSTSSSALPPADVSSIATQTSGPHKVLTVKLRYATAAELKRRLQLQAMQEACEEGNYDSLVAQVSKARVAGCLLADIEKAEAVVKRLKAEGKHVNEGCDHDTLRELMDWGKVTKVITGEVVPDFPFAGGDHKNDAPAGGAASLSSSSSSTSGDALEDGDQCAGTNATTTAPTVLKKEDVEKLPEVVLVVEKACVSPDKGGALGGGGSSSSAASSSSTTVGDEDPASGASCSSSVVLGGDDHHDMDRTADVEEQQVPEQAPITPTPVADASTSSDAADDPAAASMSCSLQLKKISPPSAETVAANKPPDYYKFILKDNVPCTVSANCPCNIHENPGEVLEFVPSAVIDCLGPAYGKNADEELFKELVESALAVEEGSVWRAGGKLIFSAFDRNQSMVALQRQLEKNGRKRCADMMLKLCAYCERKYAPGYVTAVQVNFHCSPESYHDQHRDIYSGKHMAIFSTSLQSASKILTYCPMVGQGFGRGKEKAQTPSPFIAAGGILYACHVCSSRSSILERHLRRPLGVQILIGDGLQNVAAWGGMSEGVPERFFQSPHFSAPIPKGSLTSQA
mmetsp:Transcript_20227/g.51043  ORF Transcript_20227/g.51043 Transcript_20227/m.51043 type:complete len:850 (+) Transcript_20227:120-2669(+)